MRASHTDSFCKIYNKLDPLIRGIMGSSSLLQPSLSTPPFLLSLLWALLETHLLVLLCLSLPCLSAESKPTGQNKSDGITLYWKSFNGFSIILPLNSFTMPYQVPLWTQPSPHLSSTKPTLGLASATLRSEELRQSFLQETDDWYLDVDTWTSHNILPDSLAGKSGLRCPPRFCVHLEP